MLLYNLVLFLYHGTIRLWANVDKKARDWVRGRQDWETKLTKAMRDLDGPLWMHCASLGEFEQGRPVLEKYREWYPDVPIVLSFYSPSGYQLRNNYQGADVVTYLPADTSANAKKFLTILQPRLAIFVKYDFWLHYLYELDQQKIPHYLIAGVFRPNQLFFKWYGRIFREALGRFTHLFVQDQQAAQLLRSLGIKNYSVAGDPRIDRVKTISRQPLELPIISQFFKNHRGLILGSSWPEEEAVLGSYLKSNFPVLLRTLIAPHDISEPHLSQLERGLPLPHQRYTDAKVNGLKPSTEILVLDTIGLLSSAYQYGDIAFVGGGMGKGLHNILEPAVFGLPLIFGANYHKFREARMLVERGGAFVVRDVAGFEKIMNKLVDKTFCQKTRQINQAFIETEVGATSLILNYLM